MGCELSNLDMSILKSYKQGYELCGFEGVHHNLCKLDYLDGDLELTNKGREFIKSFGNWEQIEGFNYNTLIKVK